MHNNPLPPLFGSSFLNYSFLNHRCDENTRVVPGLPVPISYADPISLSSATGWKPGSVGLLPKYDPFEPFKLSPIPAAVRASSSKYLDFKIVTV